MSSEEIIEDLKTKINELRKQLKAEYDKKGPNLIEVAIWDDYGGAKIRENLMMCFINRLKETNREIPEEITFYSLPDKEYRTDPDFIYAVKNTPRTIYNPKKDGTRGNFIVVKVDDDFNWKITEYDGDEDIKMGDYKGLDVDTDSDYDDN